MRTIEEIDREIERLRRELEAVEGTPTEVYTRIVGYYRSVKAWNRGKREEFRHRKTFLSDPEQAPQDKSVEEPPVFASKPRISEPSVRSGSEAQLVSFTRKGCPGCGPVRDYLRENGIPFREVDVDSEEGLSEARGRNILSTPTVLLLGSSGETIGEARSLDSLRALSPEIRFSAEIMA